MKALQRANEVDSALTNELNREKASGLGRTGRQLEEALATCRELEQQLVGLGAGPRREGLVAQHRETRRRALELRWYLEVQREAMGLRRHTDLDTFFPVPPMIRE